MRSNQFRPSCLIFCAASFLALSTGLSACSGGSSSGSPQPPISADPPSQPTEPAVETLPIPDPPIAGQDFLPTSKNWQLVWNDEFDGTELDTTKWAPEISCWGGGNNERQCYTDRQDNVQVINGLLRLIALEETFTGPNFPPEFNENPATTVTQNYTSGKVRTRDIADWKYGRISARMKLPAGQGTWPAFWMMPIDSVYGGWPLSGEIDIMETVNLGAACSDCSGSFENRVVGTIHYGGAPPDNEFFGGKTELSNGALPQDGYHVYSVEWGEGKILWFVDDQLYFKAEPNDWFTAAPNASGNPLAPFDQNFYVMLNLAVGGNYPESTNENRFDPASFPSEVLIDWVRVYQCETDPETGRACMQE